MYVFLISAIIVLSGSHAIAKSPPAPPLLLRSVEITKCERFSAKNIDRARNVAFLKSYPNNLSAEDIAKSTPGYLIGAKVLRKRDINLGSIADTGWVNGKGAQQVYFLFETMGDCKRFAAKTKVTLGVDQAGSIAEVPPSVLKQYSE